MDFTRKSKYFIMSDAQKNVLIKHYERGMTMTGAVAEIQEAEKETGLTTEQIKKWIGNYRAKNKPKSTELENAPAPKRIKGERKLSARNVYYSRLSKQGKLGGFKNNAERHKFVSDSWNNLDDEIKRSCSDEADKLNLLDKEELDADQIKHMIRQHRKKLFQEVIELERLGLETALMVFDGRVVSNFGSQHGMEFLEANQKVSISFQQYFDVPAEKKKPTYKDLQSIFNAAYAKAINCVGAKVPYLQGNFDIIGIPESIAWKKVDGKIKKPSDYGQSQIEEIFKQKDHISFKIHQTQTQQPTTSDDRGQYVPPFLLKLVSEEAAKEALSGSRKITEDEIEVCSLRVEEQAELFEKYIHIFNDDAASALRNKLQQRVSGIIVPTYTKNRGKFWLFYYPGSKDDVDSLDGNVNVPGHWLDRRNGSKYHVMKETGSIKRINIITCISKGEILFLEKDLDDSIGQDVVIDSVFLKKVKDALTL